MAGSWRERDRVRLKDTDYLEVGGRFQAGVRGSLLSDPWVTSALSLCGRDAKLASQSVATLS